MNQVTSPEWGEAERELGRDVLQISAKDPFTVFGITSKPVRFIEHAGPGKVETTVQTISFGHETHLFIRTPAENLVETDETIALKLGFASSPWGDNLSARDLLARRIVTPQNIDHEAIEGDALVVCFDQKVPRFAAFRTLLGVPELYYWTVDGDILCSDNLGSLISLLPALQLDSEVLPLHFLYRRVSGDRTYMQDIRRLASGSMLIWRTGMLALKRVKDMRSFRHKVRFSRVDEESTTFLFQQNGDIIGHYLKEIAQSGRGFGTLLSGGVDSSFMQLLINEHLAPQDERRSFSYVMETPAFEPEVEYATQASQLLGTKHTFVPVTPEAYLALLEDTTRILGQPVPMESLPCVLPVAQYVQEQVEDTDYLFSGAAADTLHGITDAETLWHLQQFRRLPGASLWLRLAEPFMRPIDPHKAFITRRVMALLPYVNDMTARCFPCNDPGMFTDFELVHRCFGEQAIQQAFAYRQEIELKYLNSPLLVEKRQVLGLLRTLNVASFWHQLFLAYGTTLIHPYLDERIVKAIFAFDPGIRFYNGGRTKPILKHLLEQRSLSDVVNRPKRGSGFHLDLMEWMKQGVLWERVHAIERPGFISKADFERKVEEPDWFTWSLLTLDLFRKNVLQPQLSGS